MIKKIISIIIMASGIAFAQFGKNKVQYQVFDWKYIQSEHFDVYYNEGSKYIAEYTAISAEKSLKSIESTMNYKVQERKSIIVYDSHNEFQQTNVVGAYMPEGVGGVTEMYKNRVVVPFQGDYSVLNHVIHHELVHTVVNDMFYGGTFQSAVTSGSNFMIPLWLNEGLCEYESKDGYDTETDMFMRDIAISEQLPPLNRLNGYLAYRGGQAFYWYISQEYGKERVGDFLNKLLVTRNLDAAFEASFNMDLEDFSEKWEKDMKKMYWPDLEKYTPVEDFAVQITDREKERNYYNSSPAISPNAEKMAYISAPDGIFGIYVRELDDEDSDEKLISSGRKQDFEDLNLLTPGISWNPKGDKLAISAKSGGEDAIYIVEAEDGDYEKLTWGFNKISSVTWSPDGKKLAFIGSEKEKSDIYIYNFEDETLNNVTGDIFTDLDPAWSNDSKSLFFISDRGKFTSGNFNKNNFEMWEIDVYQSDIYRISLDDNEIERITFDPENNKTSIAVPPGDNKILFTSDKNGISNVYQLDISTGISKPLTNSLSAVTQLSLSKDGSKLLFTSQVNAGYDIFMLRFPLEINLGMDELPLTTYKKELLEKQKFISSFREEETSEPAKLSGYGDFELDFSNQNIIEPNPDVQKNDNNIGTVQESEDTNRTENFAEKEYKVNFSPDLILGNPGYSTFYGVQGVTQMLFSDELGDHQIFAQANLLYDLKNSQFFVAYNYLPNIVDYSFTGYHRTAYVRNVTELTSTYDIYRFRDFGGSVKSSYPMSLFRRFEANLNWMWLSKENIDNPNIENKSTFLMVPELRYVYDNTMFGYYGPVRGTRFYVSGKYSPQLGATGSEFSVFSGDFRYYLPVVSNYVTVAMRAAGGLSVGPDARSFYLGGTENWINSDFNDNRLPFNDPVDMAFMYESFQWPLRGWAVNDARGNKYFLSNMELRFPFLTALIGPFLVQGVQGALFFDVGGAWNDTFEAFREVGDKKEPLNLLMSSGFGIRSYFLGMPLKIDIAWRNEYEKWSKPRYIFSIGYDF